MADNDSRLPVRALATDVTVEVANNAGTTINPAEDYAQGSTTTGQNGVLAQGAVTTANPAYTTGQTDPISLDTSGRLRTITTPSNSTDTNVNIDEYGGVLTTLGQKLMASSMPVVIASDQSPIPVTTNQNFANSFSFDTATAVASGATATHTYTPGAAQQLTSITFAASGLAKANIMFGTTGSEVTIAVVFVTAATPTYVYKFDEYLDIATTQSIKIVKKNREPVTAQDLYDSIQVIQ